MIYVNEKISIVDVIKNVSEYLQTQNEVMFGVCAAPIKGFIVRLLGQRAEQLHDCLKVIAEKIISTSGKKVEYAI